MARQRPQALSRRRVPDFDLTIVGARDDQVVLEFDACEPTVVSLERPDSFTAPDIPEDELAVTASADLNSLSEQNFM